MISSLAHTARIPLSSRRLCSIPSRSIHNQTAYLASPHRRPPPLPLALGLGPTHHPQHTRMFASSSRRADQPKTYDLQKTLPRLPVPDLEASLEAYVTSLVPVMEQKYDPSTLKKELHKRRLFIRDFISKDGLGRTLQQRLVDLDELSPNSWLNDTLWLSLAYHTWRAPLIVNSNWWLVFAPDANDPQPPSIGARDVGTPDPDPETTLREGEQGGGDEWIKENEKGAGRVALEEHVKKEWVTGWQLDKAAWIVRRFAEFREKLAREEVAPDSARSGPFCMEQYRHVFNFARVPQPGCDAFTRPAPEALHVSVLIDDFVYAVDFCTPSTEPHGVPTVLPAHVIRERLQRVADDARARIERGEKPVRVGILTGDERDTWTKNRETLLSLAPSNRHVLSSLSSSLLALSLDTYTLPSVPPRVPDPLYHPAVDAQIRNSATGLHGGENRWFDKPVSVLVETNGRAGMMGEHSPVDALIPSVVVQYVLKEGVPEDIRGGSASAAGAAGKEGQGESKGWEALKWTVDEEFQVEIEEARGRNVKIVQDSDASQLWWNEYGVEWIKKSGKQSPDAYLQQALQLAWYRDQGYASATYETASTRGMLHGRTDVIRSLTSESREFVKSMQDDQADSATRFALLTSACKAHTALTQTSSAGHGFDRHLMGLKTRLRAGETHALFEDEFYAKSQEWKLSTSGLSAGGQFMGTGFGAAWPDGYGINYLAGPKLIKFGIESKFSCDVTSTSRFKHRIAQALRDMRAVCEEAVRGEVEGGDGQVKSKL